MIMTLILQPAADKCGCAEADGQLEGRPSLSKNARFRSVAALTRRSKLITSMQALYGSLNPK
jgi:hypothetical protein